MAGRELVRETLKGQNARFSHPKIASSFKGWSRTMQCVLPDIGHAVTIPVRDGAAGDPVEGKAEAPEVVYEMASGTFLAITRREITGMKAFTQKLVKVKASMPDLLELQELDSL